MSEILMRIPSNVLANMSDWLFKLLFAVYWKVKRDNLPAGALDGDPPSHDHIDASSDDHDYP